VAGGREMIEDVRRQEGEPFDMLTGLAAEMLKVAEDHSTVKSIVMLTDGCDNGIALSGWGDEIEAVVYIFIHLQAMFRAAGKELKIMTEDGVFIDGAGDTI